MSYLGKELDGSVGMWKSQMRKGLNRSRNWRGRGRSFAMWPSLERLLRHNVGIPVELTLQGETNELPR
jgi:hypothetical protein